MTLKKQNAFPPYPIVTDSLVSFQYKGQLVIRIDESDRDTQPASYDEFGAFQIFRSRSLSNPKREC